MKSTSDSILYPTQNCHFDGNNKQLVKVVTEIVSIGSNRLQNWNDTQIKKWLDDKPNSDIVLFMDWGRFDSPLLDKKLVDAFWVQESDNIFNIIIDFT